jgi:hypothetical protein
MAQPLRYARGEEVDYVEAVALGADFATARRRWCGAYLNGLLSPVERKNTWQIAKAVGDPTPYALQHLFGDVTDVLGTVGGRECA